MFYKALAFSAIVLGAGLLAQPAEAATRTVKCKANVDECYRKARKQCGGNFSIIDRERHRGGLVSDAVPGPIWWYSMLVRCSGSSMNGDDGFDGGYDQPAVNMGRLQRTCRSAAARRYALDLYQVSVNPAERAGSGYAVFGEYTREDGDVLEFTCQFRADGSLRRIRD